LAVKLGPDSSKAYPEPLGWPRDQQRRYVRGLADGESGPRFYMHKGKTGKLYPNNRHVVISNTDLGLLRTASEILVRVGILSTIYLERKAGMGKSKKDAYALVITSGESLKRFSELVGFTNPDKAEKLRRVVASYKRFIKTVKSPLDERDS
jgi:intein-encoded DNA endonuclease-like protein